MSVYTKGEQMIPVLNMIGTQCAVFGNRDFGKDYYWQHISALIKLDRKMENATILDIAPLFNISNNIT